MTGLFHALYNAAPPLTWGLEATTAWEPRALVIGAIAIAGVVLGGPRAPRVAVPAPPMAIEAVR